MSRRAALGVMAAAALGYLALSTFLMSQAPDHPATLALLFGPLVFGAVGGAVQHPRPTRVLIAAAALAAMALLMLPSVAAAVDARHAYVAQHAAIHLMLAGGFAATLRPGRTPLITAMAKSLHAHWSPELELYTTALTRLWVWYFIAMVLVSLLIYAAFPWTVWTLFCTIFTPASAALLFVGEHAWRYHAHPEFERISISAAWRAYRSR